MERIVISIGGSVLVPDKSDRSYIESLAALLKELSKEYKIYVVVGGGKIARYYINVGRALGADESYLDELGIAVTRLNARLLITALGDEVYDKPAKDFDEAVYAGETHKIVIMGGTHPGHTTDAVAAMLGERIKIKRLVNATSVDGIYTSDPKKDKNAKRIEKLNYDRLIELTLKTRKGAGPNIVFDPLAARIVKRARIPLCVVNGRNLNALKNAIQGKEFYGSIVR